MTASNSVQSIATVTDERIRNALRREIERMVSIEREMTRAELADASGVNIYTIDSIMSRDPAKKRRVACEDALSLAWAIGPRAVNAMMATIGYSARRLDDTDEHQPMMIAATAMAHLSTIATAAADGRIDHTEAPGCREAADMIIATVMPLSSAAA